MTLKTYQCGIFVWLFVLAMGHLFTQEWGGRRETDTPVLKQTEEECKQKEPDILVQLGTYLPRSVLLNISISCCPASVASVQSSSRFACSSHRNVLWLPGRLSSFHPSRCCRHSDLQCVLGWHPTLRALSWVVWTEELLTKNHARTLQVLAMLNHSQQWWEWPGK